MVQTTQSGNPVEAERDSGLKANTDSGGEANSFCCSPDFHLQEQRVFQDAPWTRVIAGERAEEISQAVDFTAEQNFGERHLCSYVE
jgi:hypothetical protein